MQRHGNTLYCCVRSFRRGILQYYTLLIMLYVPNLCRGRIYQNTPDYGFVHSLPEVYRISRRRCLWCFLPICVLLAASLRQRWIFPYTHGSVNRCTFFSFHEEWPISMSPPYNTAQGYEGPWGIGSVCAFLKTTNTEYQDIRGSVVPTRCIL